MILCLNLNEGQEEWLTEKMGCKPTPKAFKKWLADGNSLEGLPPDKIRGGYRPRKKTIELAID